jgi:hypothetical protein
VYKEHGDTMMNNFDSYEGQIYVKGSKHDDVKVKRVERVLRAD